MSDFAFAAAFLAICVAISPPATPQSVEFLGDRVERVQPVEQPRKPQPQKPAPAPAPRIDRPAPPPASPGATPVQQPVVFYTSLGCAPCAALEGALRRREQAGQPFPLALDRRQPPVGESTPALLFAAGTGQARRWYRVPTQVTATGQIDPDRTLDLLLAEYRRLNPAPAAPAADATVLPTSPTGQATSAPRDAGETVVEMARRFAGQRGRFVFEPSQPINTEAADRVTVRYQRITGTYDLTTDSPQVTFDSPQPEGSAGVAGVWVGYRILGATWSPARELVRVATNWKTITLKASFGDDGGSQ